MAIHVGLTFTFESMNTLSRNMVGFVVVALLFYNRDVYVSNYIITFPPGVVHTGKSHSCECPPLGDITTIPRFLVFTASDVILVASPTHHVPAPPAKPGNSIWNGSKLSEMFNFIVKEANSKELSLGGVLPLLL